MQKHIFVYKDILRAVQMPGKGGRALGIGQLLIKGSPWLSILVVQIPSKEEGILLFQIIVRGNMHIEQSKKGKGKYNLWNAEHLKINKNETI